MSSKQAAQTDEETHEDEEDEVLDEETKRRDQVVKGAIDSLLREYSSELTASAQDAEAHQRKKRKDKKEVLLFYFNHRSHTLMVIPFMLLLYVKTGQVLL